VRVRVLLHVPGLPPEGSSTPLLREPCVSSPQSPEGADTLPVGPLGAPPLPVMILRHEGTDPLVPEPMGR